MMHSPSSSQPCKKLRALAIHMGYTITYDSPRHFIRAALLIAHAIAVWLVQAIILQKPTLYPINALGSTKKYCKFVATICQCIT